MIEKSIRKGVNPLSYVYPLGTYEEETFPVKTFDTDYVTLGQQKLSDDIQRQKELQMQKENLVPKQTEENSFDRRSSGDSMSVQGTGQYDIVKVKWDKFIKMKKRNFQTDYKILQEIGRGGFGCVYKVFMINGKIIRAAKKINKDKLRKEDHENLLSQMAIMMSLDHPNITKLYEVYDQKNHYIMVLQLCQGQELFQKIVHKEIKESETKSIIYQVLNALVYIHGKGIVHRDIKPQNMLFEKKTRLVKIIDFGISVKIKPDTVLTSRVGTPYYIAPEVLLRRYNTKCDIWSLGVVLYMIIFNSPPFQGKNHVQVMEKILKEEISFNKKQSNKFSKDAISFLKNLLKKVPNERSSAKKLLEHKWLSAKIRKLSRSDPKQKEQALNRIEKFHFKNKLQAVVHTFIVSQLLSSEQRLELLNIFRQIDKDQSGTIDCGEIKEALENKANFNELEEKKIVKIIQYVDTNCSGQIDYTQFLVAAIDFDKKVTSKHFQQAFSYFDIDNSGEITFEQVAVFLSNEVQCREQIKIMFQSVDENGDGVISKAQFVQLLVDQKVQDL